MRILIVPDSFKGSLSSIQAADAIAEGIKDLQFEMEIIREYLPQPLTDEELTTAVSKAIGELDASGMSPSMSSRSPILAMERFLCLQYSMYPPNMTSVAIKNHRISLCANCIILRYCSENGIPEHNLEQQDQHGSKQEWKVLLLFLTELFHIKPCLFHLVNLLIDLAQFMVIRCPEVSTVGGLSYLFQHIFINLYRHTPGHRSAEGILNRNRSSPL